MNFWLGTHQTEWLTRTAVPLFVSAIRLRRRPVRGRAAGPWALDSGGFTELNKHGLWSVGPQQYATEVRRWRDEISGFQWAAIQDWMCEPFVLAKTRHTVLDHQLFTVASWNDLRAAAPEIPWVPVLQGWEHDDYIRHFWLYQKYGGTDLRFVPLVGLGSVCRRQNTDMVEGLIRELCKMGVKLHGFGFKLEGLRRCSRWLALADSLAWSFRARKAWREEERRLCGTDDHRGGCANCRTWAEKWRGEVLASIVAGSKPRSRQLSLF